MTAEPLPFRDPYLSVDARVSDLLGRLTLDERIAMLHQFAPAVERLGLPAFRTGQEALHGVAWMGPATVFPQAVGIGATWNDELVRQVGEATGREVRAMRAADPRVGLNVWSPTVNLLRHPLWGRNEEGYAEDPQLTAAIATAYARGLRGDHPVYWRTAPVLKHWLAHNHERDRDTASTSVPPRVLREYELPAFHGPITSGAVAGVMPAYNLVNGRPNHLSPLLADELRRWTDLPLVVCSDAGAPSNIAGSERYYDTHEEGFAAALRAGVDSFTDHGEDSSVTVTRLREALALGLVSEADIDTAVGRLLGMRIRLGQLDPGQDPYHRDPDEAVFDTAEHRTLARETAEQAVVLLQNDGLLPLPAGARVAVVGLLADEVKLDWYSGALLHRASPLDGLRAHPGIASVSYAEGADQVRLRCGAGWLSVPVSEHTERRESGALDPALIAGRTDLPPLRAGAEADASDFALIDWGEGVLTLRAPDGRYLSVAEDGLVRASADQPGGWVVRETFAWEPHEAGHLLRHRATGNYLTMADDGLRAGERGDVFTMEVVRRGQDEVAAVAADADAVIVIAGNDPHINGRETEDRTTLALPPQQDRLWRSARAVNERTALVLVSSYPYAVPEADAELPALLWTAHGGQAAGTALARILCGDVSPAGRLPQTWYTSDEELPDLLDYDIIGSRATYLYYDGVPLYPFGHGLSYTSFGYSGLTVRAEDGDAGTLTAELTLTNTGAMAGDEVVQLYVRAESADRPRPHRSLAAHQRVRLEPGESRRVTLTAPVRDCLGFWDVAHSQWVVRPGSYRVEAGASSGDIRLQTDVTVTGVEASPRDLRQDGLAAADYDEQRGTALVDRTKERGDAVSAREEHVAGRLLFRDCDFGTGARSVTVDAAAERESVLELRTPEGELLTSITVPATGDPYHQVTVSGDITDTVVGVQDLEVTLRGSVRLSRLSFTS